MILLQQRRKGHSIAGSEPHRYFVDPRRHELYSSGSLNTLPLGYLDWAFMNAIGAVEVLTPGAGVASTGHMPKALPTRIPRFCDAARSEWAKAFLVRREYNLCKREHCGIRFALHYFKLGGEACLLYHAQGVWQTSWSWRVAGRNLPVYMLH